MVYPSVRTVSWGINGFAPLRLTRRCFEGGTGHKRHHPTTTATASDGTKQTLRNPDGSDTIFGFQCNERYLEWDDSAARQLIRIWVAEQLDTDVSVVNEKLQQLATLLPDLMGNLEKLKAGVVLELCKDTNAVAERLMELKSCLKGADVSKMVAGNLWLLMDDIDMEALEQQVERLQAALPGANIEDLLEEEPRLLLVEIEAVLQELKRLLPSMDPRQALITHGSMVLSMEEAGLPPSMLIDDGIGKK